MSIKKKNLRRQYRWRESKRMGKDKRRIKRKVEEVKKTIQVKRKQTKEERYRRKGVGVLFNFSAQCTCDEPWQACGACLPGPASPWSAQSIPHCRCPPVSPPLQIHSWRVKTVPSVSVHGMNEEWHTPWISWNKIKCNAIANGLNKHYHSDGTSTIIMQGLAAYK